MGLKVCTHLAEVKPPISAINQNTTSGKAELEDVNSLTVSYHKPMLTISAEHGKLCPLAKCACLQAWALEMEKKNGRMLAKKKKYWGANITK